MMTWSSLPRSRRWWRAAWDRKGCECEGSELVWSELGGGQGSELGSGDLVWDRRRL